MRITMKKRRNRTYDGNKGKIGITPIPIFFLILNMLLLASCERAPNSSEGVTSPTPPKSYPRVFIGGLENGECLVPQVNLWSSSDIGGSASVIDSVKGCVGLPVEIIEEATKSGRRVVKVRTYGANVGKEGWTMDTLIIENYPGQAPQSAPEKSEQPPSQSYPPLSQPQLTTSKMTEICKDTDAYFEWCYNNGVNPTTCGSQAADKMIRLYQITPTQVQQTMDYCQRNGLINLND